MVDLAELTRMIGLEPDQQSAVQAFTGDPYGTTWTDAEAAELVRVWNATDSDGIYRGEN